MSSKQKTIRNECSLYRLTDYFSLKNSVIATRERTIKRELRQKPYRWRDRSYALLRHSYSGHFLF